MKKQPYSFKNFYIPCSWFRSFRYMVSSVWQLKKSNEISSKRRKIQHQAELLESYFDASTRLCQSRIADRKGKTVFQLSK